jgi:hypothetical protein
MTRATFFFICRSLGFRMNQMSDPAKQYVAPATEQRVVMKDIFWLGSFQLNRSSAYSA